MWLDSLPQPLVVLSSRSVCGPCLPHIAGQPQGSFTSTTDTLPEQHTPHLQLHLQHQQQAPRPSKRTPSNRASIQIVSPFAVSYGLNNRVENPISCGDGQRIVSHGFLRRKPAHFEPKVLGASGSPPSFGPPYHIRLHYPSYSAVAARTHCGRPSRPAEWSRDYRRTCV